MSKQTGTFIRPVFTYPAKVPVTPTYVLIVPRRRTQDYFATISEEQPDTDNLLVRLR